MGSTPAKVDRIIARDTQTTWPDPWSLVETDYSLNCFGKVEASTKALGSVYTVTVLTTLIKISGLSP